MIIQSFSLLQPFSNNIFWKFSRMEIQSALSVILLSRSSQWLEYLPAYNFASVIMTSTTMCLGTSCLLPCHIDAPSSHHHWKMRKQMCRSNMMCLSPAACMSSSSATEHGSTAKPFLCSLLPWPVCGEASFVPCSGDPDSKTRSSEPASIKVVWRTVFSPLTIFSLW